MIQSKSIFIMAFIKNKFYTWPIKRIECIVCKYLPEIRCTCLNVDLNKEDVIIVNFYDIKKLKVLFKYHFCIIFLTTSSPASNHLKQYFNS